VPRERRPRPFWLITSLLLLALTVTVTLAPAAEAAAAYSPPSDAWARFQSDMNAAQGLATGSGVTIALLSTGADPTVPGLAGKVTNGPDYTFKPRIAQAGMLGTFTAAFFTGAPGIVAGAAPDARILAVRTEPDGAEPGAQSFYNDQSTALRDEAEGIRYAAGHGAKVILLDYGSREAPAQDLLSAVSYAVSRNVVIVAPTFPTTGSHPSAYQYPQGFPGVVGVSPVMLPGGTPPPNSVSGQSNNTVLISAPAEAVPVSDNIEIDDFWSAACYVAATVAMIKQRYPQLTPALVARALAMSARYRPRGGYSPSVGFGVLDPNDAILDAGTLARLTVSAPGGAPGTVAAAAHFGGAPPGVISALPPVGRVAYLYWALIAVGALLLGTGAVLSARRLRARSRDRRGGSPGFVPAYAGQPAAAQPDPWAAYLPPQPPAQPAADPWAAHPAPQAPPHLAPRAPWDPPLQGAPWDPAPPPDAPQSPESWVDPR
jgi:subtilase family protein